MVRDFTAGPDFRYPLAKWVVNAALTNTSIHNIFFFALGPQNC
jgi:hypothetical protein